jgi:hypothetical protein
MPEWSSLDEAFHDTTTHGDLAMPNSTRLKPLPEARARELLGMMQRIQDDPEKGLALDDRGRVTGIVELTDSREPHLLGDLDVHA